MWVRLYVCAGAGVAFAAAVAVAVAAAAAAAPCAWLCLLIVVVAVNVDVVVVVVFWHHLLFVIRFIIIVHRSVACVCNCVSVCVCCGAALAHTPPPLLPLLFLCVCVCLVSFFCIFLSLRRSDGSDDDDGQCCQLCRCLPSDNICTRWVLLRSDTRSLSRCRRRRRAVVIIAYSRSRLSPPSAAPLSTRCRFLPTHSQQQRQFSNWISSATFQFALITSPPLSLSRSLQLQNYKNS